MQHLTEQSCLLGACEDSIVCLTELWACMQVQFAILDEADTMLDVGFGEDIERILQDVPKSRQTMLFSATMPQWVQKVTQRYQNNPVLVDLIGESGSDSGKLAENIR